MEPVDELLMACAIFTAGQRRLIQRLTEDHDACATTAAEMAADLDRLEAAARHVEERARVRPRAEPGS